MLSCSVEARRHVIRCMIYNYHIRRFSVVLCSHFFNSCQFSSEAIFKQDSKSTCSRHGDGRVDAEAR